MTLESPDAQRLRTCMRKGFVYILTNKQTLRHAVHRRDVQPARPVVPAPDRPMTVRKNSGVHAFNAVPRGRGVRGGCLGGCVATRVRRRRAIREKWAAASARISQAVCPFENHAAGWEHWR